MRFSKLKTLALLLALVQLFGCSAQHKKPQSETAAGDHAPFVLIANPYQPGAVPAQAQAEFAKVREAMLARQWAQAAGLLELMIETYPRLSGLYINLGLVQKAQQHYDAAEKSFKFAIEVNPQNTDAYPPLGAMQREQGRFAEAEQTYLAALAIWPHHLQSNVNLGILYELYMGKFDLALARYQLAQKIAGGDDKQLKGWIADLERRMAEAQ